MKQLQNELTSLANRGMDRHLCLAITGLRRSGKTSFITALVNQLLRVQSGRACRYFRQHARGVCWVSNALRSVTWASSALPMIRGLAQLYGTPAKLADPDTWRQRDLPDVALPFQQFAAASFQRDLHVISGNYRLSRWVAAGFADA